MDSNTGGALGIFAFLISSAGIVYTAINHKRLRCKCCGKNMDVSVDVEPTTPVKNDEEDEDEAPGPPRNKIVMKSPKK